MDMYPTAIQSYRPPRSSFERSIYEHEQPPILKTRQQILYRPLQQQQQRLHRITHEPATVPYRSGGRIRETGPRLSAVATHAERQETMEHMLRRKTPNGTLSAAYDGSLQEWAIGPSATKIPRQAGPQRLEMVNYGSLGTTRTSMSADWLQLPPLSAESFQWNRGAQVPTVLQPMWQPAAGPTASNPVQLFGPYWPDGSYAPYKPASMRERSVNGNNIMFTSHDNASIPNLSFDASITNEGNDYLQLSGNQLLLGERHFYTTQNQSDFRSFIWKSQAGGTFEQPANTVASPLSFARAGSNHQFKDKVLVWAQKVYIELLSHLQRTGGKNHGRRFHGHPRSHSQPNIYPDPPRQTCNASDGFFPDGNHSVRCQGLSESAEFSFQAKNSEANARRHSNSTLNDERHRRNSQIFSSKLNTSHVHRQNTNVYDPSFCISSGSVYNPSDQARAALEMLNNLCQESQWSWIDGMLLGGCLAYGLEDYQRALGWYSRILCIDSNHVEAISNLAATLLALNRQEEAEDNWLRAVRLKPSYFEAVEHLIGLLCGDHRSVQAVNVIDFVEKSLRCGSDDLADHRSETSSDGEIHSGLSSDYTPPSEAASFDFDQNRSRHPKLTHNGDHAEQPAGFGSSGYKIAATENGRMLALIHAKGNLLYGLGDIDGASKAFENAVLISTAGRHGGVRGLMSKILSVVSSDSRANNRAPRTLAHSVESAPILLSPEMALRTSALVFAPHGELPGLMHLHDGMARKAALSTTSNSLLSLAKIFQDGLSTPGSVLSHNHRPTGIGDILALYYLSLSLQPSPSTANNVGILLASVQQPMWSENHTFHENMVPAIPGVIPGSGVALALAYYNYGLNLDCKHAHLFTNLGSLLKDIGQVPAAIKMYKQAVECDKTFDIALANLANAVKDQGKIHEAIEYYKRAVASNPDFAEAVCGLANALNSVCEWTDRGGVILEHGKFDRWHVDRDGMIYDSMVHVSDSGWMRRVVDIVREQLADGANWGRGIIQEHLIGSMMTQLEFADAGSRWPHEKFKNIQSKLLSFSGKGREGARIVRLIERGIKRAMHRWYRDKYLLNRYLPKSTYLRPALPNALSTPGAPTVLPFHTFTCPLTAKDIRLISERNALRISCSTLRSSWLPASVYPPPAPPSPFLNVGYVSSDFNNHPLAHLMQSVFGLHDPSRAKAFCYATTPSDKSVHRQQIEREAPVFYDASNWSAERLIQQIVSDNIHILVNLNGYTRGARNEIFAARPAPIQMSFMGFAGTLGAEWCDYLLADKIAIPPETLRPWRRNIDIEDQLVEGDEGEVDEEQWVYSENIIFCRDTFFCCDHRQSSDDIQLPWVQEQQRRWHMRKETFPNLPDSAVILGNFNQLYKIEPTTFRTWLRILSNVPRAILWLLRFPDLGESNLKKTARLWAGDEVASRIWFTDVAPKGEHISRARICDIFLDTPECNAHTTAADVLWSSTPLLTLPRYKYKMCSRMAASILTGALPKSAEGLQAGKELIAKDENQYEEFATRLANGLKYDSGGIGSGRAIEIRKLLYESRHQSALFDTARWVRDLEDAYSIAWSNWVEGRGGDIYL